MYSFYSVSFDNWNDCIEFSLFVLKSKTIAFVLVRFSQNIQKQKIFLFIFKNDSNSTQQWGPSPQNVLGAYHAESCVIIILNKNILMSKIFSL